MLRAQSNLERYVKWKANNCMDSNSTEISVKGRSVKVPSLVIGGRTVIVMGRWLKIARVRDEDWSEGEVVDSPEEYIRKIKHANLGADIFSFGQKATSAQPKYDYPFEWDNVAAIPIIDYKDWWERRLPQETRKNVRRASKRGVVVREDEFCDEFLRGVIKINNETPVRQGRPFWHYQKPFDVVKKDYATLVDRSEYLGAYCEDELIGFMKLVHMGEITGVLQILCMNRHTDKRPANLLLAKAMEICCARKCKLLVYGKYIYGKNSDSALTEFKRRNGFEQIMIPRYYVPLNRKGKIAVRLRFHLGIKHVLPKSLQGIALSLRSRWYEMMLSLRERKV